MSCSERPTRGLGIATNSASPLRQSELNNSSDDITGAFNAGAHVDKAPDSARRLLTTPSTATFSTTSPSRNDEALNDLERGQSPSIYSTKGYISWLHSPSQRNLLPKEHDGVHSAEHPFLHGHLCNNSRNFKQSMFHWPANGILALSIASTALSCLFLLVAICGPRYGERVGTHGWVTASSAAFLTSFLTKIIEVSFVTIVVAYIGQKLARKAYSNEPEDGVSFAEISMRHWAVQPGTIVSHFQAVRHAAISGLGMLTLVATIAALLYTSAATALVQPQLKFSAAENKTLESRVIASFANPTYMQQQCKTPIPTTVDSSEHRGIACFQLEQASQAYHNYQTWLAQWAASASSGNGSREQQTRLPGWALLSDNITVTAPWIEQKPLKRETNWMINNVTMAVPHPGVVAAANDPADEIMQPNELDGLGIYSIRASVPSPFINVLCTMSMSENDLDPVMSDTAGDTTDGTGTSLDEIFHWGSQYGQMKLPPIFQRNTLPGQYNTVVNDTIGVSGWGRDAIYILGRGGSVDQDGAPTDANFALCSLRVGLTPKCSTIYNASSSGGQLFAHCEDVNDDLRYEYGQPKKFITYGNDSLNADWPNVGSEWAKSIALNDGSVLANSSNARIWTQLFLSTKAVNWKGQPQYSNALPSPAEALAVMSASTLLHSAQDAPFVQTPWNYSSNPLEEPGQTQYFNASIRAQQYASGGASQYQRGFLVVLLATFLINVWILIYLLRHRYWYLDFVDPINLFPLALNSPPSVRLRESVCGDGVESWGAKNDDHFKQVWRLQTEGGHVYMESPEIGVLERDEASWSPGLRRKKAVKRSFQMVARPVEEVWERVRTD